MEGVDLFETSSEVAWAVLVILLPCYYFLHIYLESVMPDAYGINETCCYCFRKKKPVDEEEDFSDIKVMDLTKTDPSIQQDDLEASRRENEFNGIEEKLIKRKNT